MTRTARYPRCHPIHPSIHGMQLIRTLSHSDQEPWVTSSSGCGEVERGATGGRGPATQHHERLSRIDRPLRSALLPYPDPAMRGVCLYSLIMSTPTFPQPPQLGRLSVRRAAVHQSTHPVLSSTVLYSIEYCEPPSPRSESSLAQIPAHPRIEGYCPERHSIYSYLSIEGERRHAHDASDEEARASTNPRNCLPCLPTIQDALFGGRCNIAIIPPFPLQIVDFISIDLL
jgi:hypothetical protein